MIEILSLGSGLSLQDAGRPGWRCYGLPAGGAMDPCAMAQANRLLGNHDHACVLEITLLGSRFRALEDTWLAVGGADFSSRIHAQTALPLKAGTTFSFEQKAPGLYAYLALPGGIQSDQWMGSASADPRNGLGHPLEKGSQLIPVDMQANIPSHSVARRVASHPATYIPTEEASFQLYRGPQFASFSRRAQEQFIQQRWQIDARSDRSGFRLGGDSLEAPASMTSEPLLPGSFQVPGNGQPIITMPDGPTVGGYPQIAVLKKEDLPKMAQCPPRTELAFEWID